MHSHADHIGGNQYLQKRTGCRIYAPGIECSFTRHPILEPISLYGGYPPKDLKHKFLMAQESEAQYLTKLQRLFTEYDLQMNFEQYALVGSTVRSYLVWLKDVGRIEVEFTDNMVCWKAL